MKEKGYTFLCPCRESNPHRTVLETADPTWQGQLFILEYILQLDLLIL